MNGLNFQKKKKKIKSKTCFFFTFFTQYLSRQNRRLETTCQPFFKSQCKELLLNLGIAVCPL